MRLPGDSKNIIGVETSLTWILGEWSNKKEDKKWELPFVVKRNLYVGDLRLQNFGKANIFYQADIALNKNVDYMDYTSERFTPQVYSHQLKREEETAIVSTEYYTIQGFYKDKLADQLEGRYKYKVAVYVWVDLKEEPYN